MHIVQQHSNQKPVSSLNMDETNGRRMLEKDETQDDDPRMRLPSDGRRMLEKDGTQDDDTRMRLPSDGRRMLEKEGTQDDDPRMRLLFDGRRMLEKEGTQDDDPQTRLPSDIVEQQPPVMNNHISSAISHQNDCKTSVGEFRLVVDVQSEKILVGSMISTDSIPSVQSSTRVCREIACQFPGPGDICKSNSSPNVLYASELNLKECRAVDCQFPSPRKILESSSYTSSSNAPEQHFSMEDLSRERHEVACQCPTPHGIIKNHPCLTLSCPSTLPHCCVSKECHEFACQFPCAHSILDNLSRHFIADQVVLESFVERTFQAVSSFCWPVFKS